MMLFEKRYFTYYKIYGRLYVLKQKKENIMRAFQIENTKTFMNALLASEQFDSFLTQEAAVTTFNTFHIDGRIVRDFFDSGEETSSDFSLWKDIRPICFQLIKGKKPPVSFRAVLQAPRGLIDEIAADDECETAANLISSLVLNIRYDHGKLICVTGCSFTTFIMDKSAERVWDDYIGKFLMPFSPLT